MNDAELLAMAELVLQDAIAEAEFTLLIKDVRYVAVVAQKVENLRAKIAGRTAAVVTATLGAGHRIYFQAELEELKFMGVEHAKH